MNADKFSIAVVDSKGKRLNVDPHVEIFMRLCYRNADFIANNRTCWVELHRQGPKLFARLKTNGGFQRVDTGDKFDVQEDDP